MSFRMLAVSAVVVLAGIVQAEAPTGGKKLSNAQPPGEVLGFTMKGQPAALERAIPGIQGALVLSDEQKAKIFAAMGATVHSPAVRTAMARIKGDPSATEAQKEEARKIVSNARTGLTRKVSEILSPEQRALVEQLNKVSAQAQQEAAEALHSELTEAKGDLSKKDQVQKQLREKTSQVLQARLDKLLSPTQMTSYKKAAQLQIAAEEEARKHPKKK